MNSISYITLEEGQAMGISAEIDKDGSFKIQVLPSDSEDPDDAIETMTIKGIDAEYIDFEAGEYALRITAKKGTTGSMTIKPGGNVSLGSDEAEQ